MEYEKYCKILKEEIDRVAEIFEKMMVELQEEDLCKVIRKFSSEVDSLTAGNIRSISEFCQIIYGQILLSKLKKVDQYENLSSQEKINEMLKDFEELGIEAEFISFGIRPDTKE